MIALAAKAKLVQGLCTRTNSVMQRLLCTVCLVCSILDLNTDLSLQCYLAHNQLNLAALQYSKRAAPYDALLQLPTGRELIADVSVSVNHCGCLGLAWHLVVTCLCVQACEGSEVCMQAALL